MKRYNLWPCHVPFSSSAMAVTVVDDLFVYRVGSTSLTLCALEFSVVIRIVAVFELGQRLHVVLSAIIWRNVELFSVGEYVWSRSELLGVELEVISARLDIV